MAEHVEVDELFGSDGPRPRTALILGLLVPGVILSILGLVCTSAPGGVLILAAWTVVEKDLDRIDAGYLPQQDRAQVQVLLRLTQLALALVIVLFFVESVLLCQGVYPVLWGTLLKALVALFGATPA